MSRSVSAPSSVTNTSPCWNGFIVPGSTLRYGSSFCMVTRRPLPESNAPRELAVRPLPSDDTTPPVTKTNFVGWELGRRGPRSRGAASRPTGPHVTTVLAVVVGGPGDGPARLPLPAPRPDRRSGHQPHEQRQQQGRGRGRQGDAAVVDQRADGQAERDGGQPGPQHPHVLGRQPAGHSP